jgi:hypothetical protein
MCNIDAEEEDVAVDESAGVKRPLSRNDLILDIRSREEAEGERRMIGSGRRTGAFELIGSVVPFDAAGFELLDVLNCTANFRTYEKSCYNQYSPRSR